MHVLTQGDGSGVQVPQYPTAAPDSLCWWGLTPARPAAYPEGCGAHPAPGGSVESGQHCPSHLQIQSQSLPYQYALRVFEELSKYSENERKDYSHKQLSQLKTWNPRCEDTRGSVLRGAAFGNRSKQPTEWGGAGAGRAL